MPISRQPDLFSSAMQQPYTLPVSNGNKTFNGKEQEVIGDLFSQQNGMAKLISQPFRSRSCRHSRTCAV